MSGCFNVGEGYWWKMYFGEYVWNFMLFSPIYRNVFTNIFHQHHYSRLNDLHQLQKNWRVGMTVWKKDGVLKFLIFYLFQRRLKGFKLIVLARRGTRLILFFVWIQSIIYILHSLNYPVVTFAPIHFNQRQ